MAVDGHVDIAPILDKARLNSAAHDGKGVAEGHAELEVALAEIFGIELGQQISGSIFGDGVHGDWGTAVQSDGSWTYARFTRAGSASSAVDAVGWEFSDKTRSVRLVLVGGTIQLWELNGTTWEQKIDLEYAEPTALTDLADVPITASQANDDSNIGQCLKVSGEHFVFGDDTLTNGATKWKDLTDVKVSGALNYGPIGSAMVSKDSGVWPVVLAGEVAVASSFSLTNYLVSAGQAIILQGPWIRELDATNLGLTGYERVVVGSDGSFYPPVAGVYKIILSYQMVAGHVSPFAIDPVGDVDYHESDVRLPVQTNGFHIWPPPSVYALKEDPWWAFVKDVDIGALQLDNEATVLIKKDTSIGSGEFSQFTFFGICDGNSTSKIKFMFYFDMRNGARVMDFHVSFERVT